MNRVLFFILFCLLWNFFCFCKQKENHKTNKGKLLYQPSIKQNKTEKIKIDEILFDEKKAKQLQPLAKIQAKGGVVDIVYRNGLLYVASDKGTVEVFNLESKKKIKQINLPPITNFEGDFYSPKVFSIDLSPDNNKISIVAERSGGKRNLYLYEQGKLITIDLKSANNNFVINKVKFIDHKKIVLGLLSNELLLYDLEKRDLLKKKQINMSSFSDFALNNNKSKIAVSDEAGEISILDVNNWQLTKILKGVNVDRVYKVSYKKNTIIGGGQDRRVAIYYENKPLYKRISVNFLVYAVALSEDARLAAFLANEDNCLGIINLENYNQSFLLKGHKTNPNNIIFIDENSVISSSDDPTILFWRLK